MQGAGQARGDERPSVRGAMGPATLLLTALLLLLLSWSRGAEVAVGIDGMPLVESTAYYESLLDRFGAAFNAHDAAALVSMMTADAVFRQSAGAEGVFTGAEVVGTENLQRAFEGTFTSFPDSRWVPRGPSFVAQIAEGVWRGASEWTFQGTRSSDGARFDVNGVDIFVFKNGQIAVKDAFRKDVPPSSKP